jgi:hypothetical protein
MVLIYCGLVALLHLAVTFAAKNEKPEKPFLLGAPAEVGMITSRLSWKF